MKKILASIFFVLSITSCVFKHGPPDNAPFFLITSLEQLEGHYTNIGDDGGGSIGGEFGGYHYPLLSKIMWTNDISVDHGSISEIEVRSISANTLQVKALNTSNEVVQVSNFIAGKDFKFTNGKIFLRSSVHMSLGPDDPIFGPKYEWFELGIDTKGDGKYSHVGSVVGLAYLFFPIIGADKAEVRFRKIKE